MSEEFKVEIINPDKSFLTKDHISIISFLKPGIIKIFSKSTEEKYYIEDGILEFKNNNLSVLTSSIYNFKDLEKDKIQELLKLAEEDANRTENNDQSQFLADQKVEVLKTIN